MHKDSLSLHAFVAVSEVSAAQAWVPWLAVETSSLEQSTLTPFAGSRHEYFFSMQALVAPVEVST